jgi:hypothetical protein
MKNEAGWSMKIAEILIIRHATQTVYQTTPENYDANFATG